MTTMMPLADWRASLRILDFLSFSAPTTVSSVKSVSSGSSKNHVVAVYFLCVLPAFLSVTLSFLLEVVQALRIQLPEIPLALLAAALFLVAIPLTHGVSGKQLHPTSWKFYQPLKGGAKFIAIQLFSWLFFAMTIISAALWFFSIAENNEAMPGLWASAGLGCAASESLMLASIQAFDASSAPISIKILKPTQPEQARTTKTFMTKVVESLKFLRMHLVVAVFCNMAFALISIFLAPFILLPFHYAVPASIAFWTIYSLTYIGEPANTGARRWDWFRRSFFVQDIVSFFRGKVIVEPSEVDASKSHIFAFAPHGIMPLTGVWLPNHVDFLKAFGQLDVFMLGATVFHVVPILRDPPMWAGTRQVTLPTFLSTLREGKSALMIPGGISELALSSSREKVIKVMTRHKGFIKVALQTGASLVPVFSFGETLYFDFVEVPFVSKFLMKYLHMPFPYFVGVGNVLQFPRRCDVTVIIGKPIPLEKIEHPTAEQIDELHHKFYECIRDLFERYKEQCGHGDFTLQFVSSKNHHHHHRHHHQQQPHALVAPALSNETTGVVSASSD